MNEIFYISEELLVFKIPGTLSKQFIITNIVLATPRVRFLTVTPYSLFVRQIIFSVLKKCKIYSTVSKLIFFLI